MKELPFSKQLAPLILFIVLIIVLTLVIGQNKNIFKNNNENSLYPHPQKLEMRLSPFHYNIPEFPDYGNLQYHIVIPTVETALAQALEYSESGRYHDAEEIIRNALVFNKSNRALLSFLGTILFRQQKYKAAETVFRHQTILDPTDTLAYNNLGASLAKQNRYQEAIRSVKMVYLHSSKDHQALSALNLSGMYSISGNTAEALAYFKKAYESLGEQILPLSYNSNFDNIRGEKEFQNIVRQAQQQGKQKSNSGERQSRK